MRAIAGLALAVATAAACTHTLPPEPPHFVTIGDASFSGTYCDVAFDVLEALGCPESLHSKTLFVQKCQAIGDDFDFACVASATNTDQVRACYVRCDYDADGGP